MKKYILIAVAMLLASGSASAQLSLGEKWSQRRETDDTWRHSAKYAFGIHTGIDIGAAAPSPLGKMGASNMSAIPKLNTALGLSVTSYPVNRLTATVEVTYKQVGIDAKARVSGQRFTLIESNGNRKITEFRGTARVKMSFPMLEIPLYAGYTFGDGRNRVILGVYYSRIFSADFETTPLKGVVINPEAPNEPPIEVTPSQPVPGDVMPDFNEYLDKWDMGILAGYEWQIIPRIHLGVRFSTGFKDIFRKNENYLDYKMLHMRGSLTLSYSFLRYTK